MSVFQFPEASPTDFERATSGLRSVRVRPEITLTSIPAPARIAPYSIAVEADVEADERDLGGGRFIVLHDPEGRDEWEGVFRIVTYTTCDLEPELGTDPLFGEVAWSWLTGALGEADAMHHALSGTVTRVINETFGEHSGNTASTSAEMRASWTPTLLNLAPHFSAWAATLGEACGLPPMPRSVSVVPRTGL